MVEEIDLGGIPVDVVFKDVKHVHLSVYPPTGRVRITAPSRMSLETIRVFAISKLGWIRQEQKKLREQERETPREYVERESHYVWGSRYLLKIVEMDECPAVTLTPTHLVLKVRPGTGVARRQKVIDEWYRKNLKEAVQPLIYKWEPVIGVKVNRFYVQRMKTKWGSCNHLAGTIRLNTELAKKPKECLEYLVVHEMVHILEPSHNARFVSLMNAHMSNWQAYRDLVNQLPVSHQCWSY